MTLLNMYHLITGLYAEWTKKARFNVLMVGPSGVGKSCLLEKIKSLYLQRTALPPNKIAPTVGQNVLEVTLPNMHLHFWDLGGSASVRALWSKYYDESDAIVWVVDARHFLALDAHKQKQQQGDIKGKGKASEPDAGSEAYNARESSWKLLSQLLIDPSLEGRPILIVANKTDDCGSISPDFARTIKSWFAEKITHTDADPADATSKLSLQLPIHNGNVFADDEEESYRSPVAAGSRLNDKEYEWDVILASAIEG